MIDRRRPLENLRPHFDKIYDSCIVGSGFFESDDYYRNEKERYWRSLELLCTLNLGTPARMLEIGGGQMSVLCKNLFSDECIVADISRQYVASLQKSGIELITFNLMDSETNKLGKEFDIVVLLEVIEHIPIPAYVLMERLKSLLAPNGVVFLTTRNLFRVRNLIRMFLGIEFLDRFSSPEPGESLGHQLEYSADHLRWQMERAGMQILLLREDSLGRTGHSVKARFARTLLAPLELRPIWRDGLVAAVRKPA
jgi:hypothetical protein